MIKKETGLSFVLVGALIVVLLFTFSNDSARITGYFLASGISGSVVSPNATLDNNTNPETQVGQLSGGPTVSGFSILDNPTNKMVAYAIFIIVIVIGVILIVWSSWNKKKSKDLKKKNNSSGKKA
jgi:hypothetical protein